MLIFQLLDLERRLIWQKICFMKKCYFSLNQPPIWWAVCWKNLKCYLISNHLKDLTPSLAWELVFATKTTYQQKRKSHHSHPSSAKVSAIWVSTFCTLGNLEFPSVGRKICQLKHHDAGKKLEIAHKKNINEFIR